MAKRDNNQVTTIEGVLNSDGVTPTGVKVDPTTHVLMVGDAATGSDNSATTDAQRDGNRIPTLLAASESDGSTPVPLYVDSSGNLLIDSN